MKPLFSIQYLRAGAALAVVIYHALQWRSGGFDVGRAGVDVFFVISGVIMWRVTAGAKPAPLSFLMRRLTRVAPLYWLVTLLVTGIAILWPMFLPQVFPDPKALGLSLAFIPHLDHRGLPFPTLPLGWTLDYEAMFYLVFAVALLAPLAARAWLVTAILTGIALAGFVLDDQLYFLGANPMLLQFAAGVWIGEALRRGVLPARAWGLAMIVAAFGFWTLIEAGGLFVELWRPLQWGLPAALLVAGALAVETDATLPDLRPLKQLGDASFAIYLVHMPATALVAHTLRPRLGWLFLPAAVGASIALGLAVHVLIERPLIAWTRSLFRGRRPEPGPVEAQGHFTTGGIEERIEVTLPPVFSPNIVPRS
jgi:exopolysaccharide production protein ExoZ